MGDDPESDALERELEDERRNRRQGLRRLALFVPPLAALLVAGIALGLSRPRDVFAGRASIAGRPPADAPLTFRVMAIRALGGVTVTTPAPGLELRVSHGRVGSTDDDGAAEVIVDAPLPAEVTIEGRVDGAFRPLLTFSTGALPPPRPDDGLTALSRSGGSRAGALVVDAAPELSALAPPLPGAAWVWVRDLAGMAVSGATVTLTGEAGLDSDPPTALTDANGLARLPLAPKLPPVLVAITARRGITEGTFRGTLGAVLAPAVPPGDGVIAGSTVELRAPATRTYVYADVLQNGVRVLGQRLAFQNGVASLALPPNLKGVIDLSVSSSATAGPSDDAAHVVSWPLVLAGDAPDAWAAVAVSPRLPEQVKKTDPSLGAYRAVVAATLARARIAFVPRGLELDGLPKVLNEEIARVRRVRRGATLGILGGGLVEIGLMLGLGIFAARTEVDDALARERGEDPRHGTSSTRKIVGLLCAGIGIVAMVFAAMALMAWGMPS